MRRRMAMLAAAVMMSGVMGAAAAPVWASDGISLEECLKGGGHASGKYCSGGRHDGKLIID